MKKTTIGDWAEKNGATIRNSARWTVVHDYNGSHFSVRMRVIVVKDSRVIAEADLSEVLRGADEPHHAGWGPGSAEAKSADEYVRKAEDDERTGKLDAYLFHGYSYALPWEVATKRRSVLAIVKSWLRG